MTRIDIQNIPVWYSGLVSFISAMIGAGFGGLITYWIWKQQKREEPLHQEKATKYARRIEARMAAWSLLAFITRTENERSILHWVKDKGSREITWYFIPAHARKYISELANIFYLQGHGLFMDKEIKELLFTCRSILFGLLLTEQGTQDEKILLKNPEKADDLLRIYDELNERLKNKI